MDDSLKKLETQLQNLVPRGLSDDGQDRCDRVLDKLAADTARQESVVPISESPVGLSWKSAAVAAAVTLLIGVSAGWHLGSEPAPLVDSRPGVSLNVSQSEPSAEYVGLAYLDYFLDAEEAAPSQEGQVGALETRTEDPETGKVYTLKESALIEGISDGQQF